MTYATRDHLIHAALASGHFTTNPDTGWVLRHGEPVGVPRRDGYITVPYCRTRLLAHRVVWIAAHGPAPDDRWQINHRNQRTWDNRLANLEPVTPKQNAAHRLRNPYYTRMLPDDLAAIDPDWLSEALALSTRPDVSTEDIRALVGGVEQEPSGPYQAWVDPRWWYRTG